MTRIKICGMTRPEDAVAAADAGVDAIGLVFADSPRRVTMEAARVIVKALPPFVSAVGLFVNSSTDEIRRTADVVGLNEIQLHGDEEPEIIGELAPFRVIKALRVRDRSFIDQVRVFKSAGVSAVLLDAWSADARGGTGKHFDWDLLIGATGAGAAIGGVPWILAGGLTPLNVQSAVRRVRPWGVDVSSGVESELGVKCAERMAQFLIAVRGGA